MDTLLLTAAALACPIGMGIMMLFMMRGQHGGTPSDAREIERLKLEIDLLKTERQIRDLPTADPAKKPL